MMIFLLNWDLEYSENDEGFSTFIQSRRKQVNYVRKLGSRKIRPWVSKTDAPNAVG